MIDTFGEYLCSSVTNTFLACPSPVDDYGI